MILVWALGNGSDTFSLRNKAST